MHLVHHHLFRRGALVDEFDDVKPGRGAQRLAHRAWLHGGDRVREKGRKLRRLLPAELPALERGLAVRIGDRELPEILTLRGAVVHFLRA